MSLRPQPGPVVTRARLLAPLLALPLAVAACGGGEGAETGHGAGGHAAQAAAAKVPEPKVYTIEELAEAIGCGKPKIQIKGADITSGYCNAGKQRYFLNVFPDLTSMRAWAAEEQGWGSVLVGNQWAIGVAPDSLLPELQQKLGGTIQGEHVMASDGEARQAGSHDGHGGH
ncbi:MAG: hypothetical protein DIU60_001350 [Actinomycetes bacterium]